jgi:hypothetical protein
MSMDILTASKVDQFARLAAKAGWDWCGVQDSLPYGLPALMIQQHGIIRHIVFDPADFDPIKIATLRLVPQEKK